MERTISGLARWDYLGRPLKVGRTEMSLSIWQNCPIFRFENKPSSGAKRRFVFRPKYWAICVNIYFLFYSLVLFVASCFSTSFICTDPGLQLGDPAPFIGLLLWTCWYFLYWNPLVPARGLNFLSINIACPAFNKFITVGSRDHSCKVGSSSRCDRFFGGGRKGLRWCGFALFLVRFCGNFYFNSRYCGFKTLSGLRLLQPLSRGFRWKKVSAVITLFRTVGIRLFCKREPSVLFYNASGFIISAYNLTLWFAITAFSS